MSATSATVRNFTSERSRAIENPSCGTPGADVTGVLDRYFRARSEGLSMPISGAVENASVLLQLLLDRLEHTALHVLRRLLEAVAHAVGRVRHGTAHRGARLTRMLQGLARAAERLGQRCARPRGEGTRAQRAWGARSIRAIVDGHERHQPVLDSLEGLGLETVVAVLAHLPHGHEARLAQHLEVFRDGWLAEPQFLHQLADADVAGGRV